MAAIKWQDVSGLVPSLAALATEGQDGILAFVNAYFSPTIWGGEDSVRYKMARVFLAAHLATMSPWGGVSGRVTSKTISTSSASINYAQKLTTDGLELTEWGQMLRVMMAGNAGARMPLTWGTFGR